MRHLFVLAAAAAIVFPRCAQAQPVVTPPPAPPPSATPAANAQPSPAPLPAPSLPSAAPTPVPASAPQQPSPVATQPYNYVYTPPPGQAPGAGGPVIREIDLSDQTLITPGELRVQVLTSSDVVSVIARTVGREISLPQMQSGRFGASAYVPSLPWYLRNRTYAVEFVAAAPSGRTASVTLSLGLK